MNPKLEVWLFNHKVGTLSLKAGRLSFNYEADWLSNPKAMPLSISLPLQPEPFDDQQTRPFFAGLLPEGQMRRLLAQQLQISGQNDFALLNSIGGECAGAVSFLEPGQSLSVMPLSGEIQWLNDEELASILDELPQRPMLAGQKGIRLSLAGAQDKLPVVFDGVRIGLPLNGTPSSHILKPTISAIEDSVINEGYCMTLAKAMNLSVAKAEIHTCQGRSFLLVERYDRFLDERGQRHRLHQEDFCQALSVIPEMKYQNEGGPDLKQCFNLVRRVTHPNAPQILRLLDYVIFNALIGNHDAHAKNFSLLYSENVPVLAPAYDLLSTSVYPRLSVKMAMKIGSRYKFSELECRHWERFAEETDLAKAQAKKRIIEFATRLPPTARKLQKEAQSLYANNALVEKINLLIEQRCQLTIRRLSNRGLE